MGRAARMAHIMFGRKGVYGNFGRADCLTPYPLSRARRGNNAPKARAGEGLLGRCRERKLAKNRGGARAQAEVAPW